MRILGIIIWVVGVLWAVGHGFNIRNKARNEQATEHTFELHALLLALSVIVIPVFSVEKGTPSDQLMDFISHRLSSIPTFDNIQNNTVGGRR